MKDPRLELYVSLYIKSNNKYFKRNVISRKNWASSFLLFIFYCTFFSLLSFYYHINTYNMYVYYQYTRYILFCFHTHKHRQKFAFSILHGTRGLPTCIIFDVTWTTKSKEKYPHGIFHELTRIPGRWWTIRKVVYVLGYDKYSQWNYITKRQMSYKINLLKLN